MVLNPGSTSEMRVAGSEMPDVGELVTRKKNGQQLGLEVRSDALQITFGDTPAFEQTQARGIYIIRTMFVCVENIDKSHFITNCKIHGDFNGGHHLLVDSFTLNATEKRYIPIAVHHEMPADKFIHIQAPRGGGFFAEAYDYLKLSEVDPGFRTIG